MKLYYYKDKKGNFGDDLNEWLWNRLLPGYFDDDDSTLFVGIGTLLNSLLPPEPFKIIFSSGVGYKEPPRKFDNATKVYCVRGPLSAKQLGIEEDLAITDGAALLKAIPFPKVKKKYRVSFVPHHLSHRDKWEQLCRKIGINYIDPAHEVEFVLSEIRKSELVIAESMHGAIIADIFRVPWIPVKLHDHILDFKWNDWCQSLDLNYDPIRLPSFLTPEYKNKYYIRFKYTIISFGLKFIAMSCKSFMSSDKKLESTFERLLEKLDEFKRDYGVKAL